LPRYQLCARRPVAKLTSARPYRPLPPWQAIGARLFVRRPLWTARPIISVDPVHLG